MSVGFVDKNDDHDVAVDFVVTVAVVVILRCESMIGTDRSSFSARKTENGAIALFFDKLSPAQMTVGYCRTQFPKFRPMSYVVV